MTVTLLGIPPEIAADAKILIVDSEAAAARAKALLPSYCVLWPSEAGSLHELSMEAWIPLQGSDVLLWPSNIPACRKSMTTAANALQRVTDRVRMIYVNGAEPAYFSAADMGEDWNTGRLIAWAKERVRPYEKEAPPDPMADIEAVLPEREPGCDDEPIEVPDVEAGPERRRIKWADLEGKTPPERNWIINHWLTYSPTLLAGAGGIGKTLLSQTIATAIALGRSYVDEISTPANVLFWACEDDHDELWRRQLAICQYFGVGLAELEGKLIIEPRLGLDNSLMLPTFGAPTWTPLRQELRAQVNDYGAKVLIMDNIGQCFGGNENDRHHVTSFVSGLVGLSDEPLAVLMLGHPAKSLNSEYSGSTAWENAVRMRWYLGTKLPDKKQDEDEEPDTSIRFLCKRKTNYSQLDYRQLTYLNGAYQCDTPAYDGPSFRDKYGSVHRKDAADALVMAAVRQFFEAGVRVVEGAASSDHILKKMQEIRICQDYTTKELNEALTRLRLSGRVITAPLGKYPNRLQKYSLAPLGSI